MQPSTTPRTEASLTPSDEATYGVPTEPIYTGLLFSGWISLKFPCSIACKFLSYGVVITCGEVKTTHAVFSRQGGVASLP